MTLACVRGCAMLRRHLTDCLNPETCRGCLPRLADHGLLCWPCHRRLELMLTDAPTVHDWLTANLPSGTGGAMREDYEKSTMTGEGSPAPLHLGIYDTRQDLRDKLRLWVIELVEERDLKGPDQHSTKADADYLLAWLDKVETYEWVTDLWAELADAMVNAHALAPWRPQARRCYGIACPECNECALVIFGGETDVQCLRCRTVIPPERYGIWVSILLEEKRTLSAA